MNQAWLFLKSWRKYGSEHSQIMSGMDSEVFRGKRSEGRMPVIRAEHSCKLMLLPIGVLGVHPEEKFLPQVRLLCSHHLRALRSLITSRICTYITQGIFFTQHSLWFITGTNQKYPYQSVQVSHQPFKVINNSLLILYTPPRGTGTSVLKYRQQKQQSLYNSLSWEGGSHRFLPKFSDAAFTDCNDSMFMTCPPDGGSYSCIFVPR